MSVLNRRNALAAIAGASAAGMPALAAIPDQKIDAELIELGKRLDELHEQEWVARHAADDEIYAIYEEVTHRVGFDIADRDRKPSEQECHLWWDTEREVRKELGADAGRRHETVWGKIDAHYKRMIECTPQTLAGVGVLARACVLQALSDCWKSNTDYPDDVTRNLVEILCRAGGVEVPFERGLTNA